MDKSNVKKTAIIILNYNNFEDTNECIKSLLNANIRNIDIVVVDNASTDGSGDAIYELFGNNITYLHLEKNCGYAIGNNEGIKYACKKKYEYICVLNNDTVVNSDFVSRCIDVLNSRDDVGFVAPVLLNYDDGKVQSTGGRIDLWFGDTFERWRNDEIKRNIGKRYDEVEHDVECDYVGGACLVFKSSMIDEIGLIPEIYFLFFEETEWCLKAIRKGYKNLCLCNCEVRHKGSSSIDRVGGLHEYMITRNRVLFEKRNCINTLQFVVFMISLNVKTFISALVVDHSRFRWIGYYRDGLYNRINPQFNFVITRDNNTINKEG